jgi:hypothetical protein
MCRTSLVAVMACGANRVDAYRWRAPGTSGVTSRHAKCGVSPPCARPPAGICPHPSLPHPASQRLVSPRHCEPAARSARGAARNPRSRHAYCNGTPPRSAVPQWRYVARHAYRPPNLWIHRVRQPGRHGGMRPRLLLRQLRTADRELERNLGAAGRPGRGRGITTAREIGREARHTPPPAVPGC